MNTQYLYIHSRFRLLSSLALETFHKLIILMSSDSDLADHDAPDGIGLPPDVLFLSDPAVGALCTARVLGEIYRLSNLFCSLCG